MSLLAKLSLRSFRHTVLALVWTAVSVPILMLCAYQLRNDYEQRLASNARELAYETERASFVLTQNLRQLMGDLDRIASDGSVIRSLSMPILTPISVKKIEEFLGHNPASNSVMLIDKELFPIEVLPTWALTDDLSIYESFMQAVVSSPSSISDPRPRLFIVTPQDNTEPQLVFIRPILSASDSLSQPFQVNGLLLVNVGITKLMRGLDYNETNKPELLRLLNQEQLLFEERTNTQDIEINTHQAPLIIGLDEQKRLALEVGRSPKGVMKQVLMGYRAQAAAALLFMILMLIVVKKLADKLAHPLELLSQVTNRMSKRNFQEAPGDAVDTHSVQYHEFSEAFQLLSDMETTIRQQFQQLHDANATLEDKVAERTEALKKNIALLDDQRESLQRLVQYSIEVQQIASLDELGPMTLALADSICNQQLGIYLLRSEFFSGYEQLDQLQEKSRAFLRAQHAQLNDYASLLRLAKNTPQLHFFPIGSSTPSYQGFLITERSEHSEHSSEALMVLSTMLVSAIKQHTLNTKLHRLAHIDSVTRLPNRHYFTSKFSEMLNRFNNNNPATHFGVFVIDVNGLKFINDHYGHQYGDEMLKIVANAIQQVVRANDTLARVGGDEFYIILENASADTCEKFAIRMRDVSAQLTMNINDQLLPISFSLGYASTDQDSLRNLLSLADERMYFEKKKHYKNLSGH
ncbi:GGDEF domain-containing protein [Cellvibrio japonicus]|uniref:diguanylate cyclase n=1 Tax=Cellvibrio japonicus (strain Ueda107) TaxID=498211 RepID=B3PD35_CELJU|nr:GGDEF domain-containing protein [Cellvibrio japonicus]ACE84253.1 GGDEF domain protein [Cellvibrio japonicus Ueda107]QEI11969.1 GGDEF domain-containing protein [Cellvibrio japonicus]QEI15543.1 GGDEF domain-containing protein [Cellvibrio japonicus]QEI19122.1 GGDEF domain-containing protein [Cellvibrio japonicus]